jgi:hypothetical protein
VDYSLFMVVMSKRLEKRSGATPVVFLPPIFAGTTSISVFLHRRFSGTLRRVFI